MRLIALDLIKREETQKARVKGKRLKAGWDEDYLLKTLSGLCLYDVIALVALQNNPFFMI